MGDINLLIKKDYTTDHAWSLFLKQKSEAADKIVIWVNNLKMQWT
jgi:hypothetical protein